MPFDQQYEKKIFVFIEKHENLIYKLKNNLFGINIRGRLI